MAAYHSVNVEAQWRKEPLVPQGRSWPEIVEEVLALACREEVSRDTRAPAFFFDFCQKNTKLHKCVLGHKITCNKCNSITAVIGGLITFLPVPYKTRITSLTLLTDARSSSTDVTRQSCSLIREIILSKYCLQYINEA